MLVQEKCSVVFCPQGMTVIQEVRHFELCNYVFQGIRRGRTFKEIDSTFGSCGKEDGRSEVGGGIL